MPYIIKWAKKTVCVNYTGNIDNEEIIRAHLEINNDERFHDYPNLILDITQCNMDNVKVSGLVQIVGLDLGNLIIRDSFKIAMLANDPENIEKALDYIKRFKKLSLKIELFSSIDDANLWINI